MPKQPSRLRKDSGGQARPRAVKDDLDLTPPEEIRARQIRRFVFLGAIAAAVLGVGIYFAARPIGGAIKAWQARRQAREAFALIDQRKWNEASAKARDALLLRPTEPEAWRAIARLASRTAQWAVALEWWKKVDDEHRLTITDRRDYVSAGLATGEISVAAKQVEALLAQRAGLAPIDIIFAGQVAARQSDPVLAVDYAERALADQRAEPYDILSAATLILSVTNPQSPLYASAWQKIEAVARDPKNPGSLDALAVFANEQALPPMPPIGGNASLSLDSRPTPQPTPATEGAASAEATAAYAAVSPDTFVAPGDEGGSPPQQLLLGSTPQPTPVTQTGDTLTLTLAPTPPPVPGGTTMSLLDVANALESHPDARPFHKLLALGVRARQDPILTDRYVADAVQRFGNGDDETLLALVAWLNRVGRPAKTLEVLPQARAVQRQDFFLHYINALAALQRWNDVKELLISERAPIEPMVQHMYLAVAQAHLGSATGATNEWQRALEVAKTPEKLSALAKYAEQNSAYDTADAAYSEAIKIGPKNRGAYDGRVRLALAAGRTAQAQTITAEIAQLWPDDAGALNQDAYLRLLLGASDSVAEVAERDAEILVRAEPRNWLARATLGLARLRLDRKQEALAAIRQPRVTGIEPPGAMAVRAAILAANGYEEGAQHDARLLSAKPLLPEERALIAPLLQ